MDLLLVGLLVMAVAAVVAVALGRVPGGMAPVDDTLPPPLEEPLERPEDLDRARFSLALRGYRQDQVDEVLDEARDLLAAKDEEIARLRAQVPPVYAPGPVLVPDDAAGAETAAVAAPEVTAPEVTAPDGDRARRDRARRDRARRDRADVTVPPVTGPVEDRP